MKEHTLASTLPWAGSARPSWSERLMRRIVLAKLAGLSRGHLSLIEPGGRVELGEPAETADLRAQVTVHDPTVYRRVALGGTIGAGEAYMAGMFDCDDLPALVRLFVANREVMQGLELGWAQPARWLDLIRHRLNLHGRAASRRNIEAHYDLGNAFFERFLDSETMMYSAAMFPRADADLAEGQRTKLDAICRKLELGPEDHLLEIGTGWGGLAIHAARTTGCRVTTATISPAQYEYARRRVAEAGLSGRVEVLLRDYRDLEGQFDKLVSVEMIEAIGHRHYGTYFAQCARLLKPGGLMLIQAITIAERHYEQARRSVDFIQRYIFPGGGLPSVSAMTRAVARHTDLDPVQLEDFGGDYALTLRHWRERLRKEWSALRRMGCTETFLRMWEFYLGYCEGGFLERSTGVVHMVLAKPDWRPETISGERGSGLPDRPAEQQVGAGYPSSGKGGSGLPQPPVGSWGRGRIPAVVGVQP